MCAYLVVHGGDSLLGGGVVREVHESVSRLVGADLDDLAALGELLLQVHLTLGVGHTGKVSDEHGLAVRGAVGRLLLLGGLNGDLVSLDDTAVQLAGLGGGGTVLEVQDAVLAATEHNVLRVSRLLLEGSLDRVVRDSREVQSLHVHSVVAHSRSRLRLVSCLGSRLGDGLLGGGLGLLLGCHCVSFGFFLKVLTIIVDRKREGGQSEKRGGIIFRHFRLSNRA